MKITTTAALTTLALLTFSQAQEADETFTKACAVAAEIERPEGQTGVPGADPDWYFFYKELNHLALGEFWAGDYSTTASTVDPTPFIIDYHEQLKALGVELLFVPVPPKASVYPEKFNPVGKPTALAPFLKKLTEAGVRVIDLEEAFKAEREKNPDKLLYCKTDSHYSPYATQLVAGLIHEKYKDSDWAKAITSDVKFVAGEAKDLTFIGDLTETNKETIPIVEVNNADNEQIFPENDESPILLLGDSHAQAFSTGGEFHAKAAGLPDHLQANFGAPIHMISSPSSGAYMARSLLARKSKSTPDYWNSKKLVIWHFTARDLTQEPKWKTVPAKP